ncbi:uncharacterized protein [Dysidea avara]|uniref:uncharacterized protein isoform X2 n=1 Tax=Dysidea avara TaxID=196820 RepID=UPI00331960FA
MVDDTDGDDTEEKPKKMKKEEHSSDSGNMETEPLVLRTSLNCTNKHQLSDAKLDSKATKETKEQVLIIKTIPRTTIGSTEPTDLSLDKGK